MADFGLAGTVLPIIFSVGTTLAVVAMAKFSKTSESTISGTIRMENVQADVSKIEAAMKDGFHEQKQFIEQLNKENREEFGKVWKKLYEISERQSVIEYRVGEHNVDRKYRDDNHGGKGAV